MVSSYTPSLMRKALELGAVSLFRAIADERLTMHPSPRHHSTTENNSRPILASRSTSTCGRSCLRCTTTALHVRGRTKRANRTGRW